MLSAREFVEAYRTLCRVARSGLAHARWARDRLAEVDATGSMSPDLAREAAVREVQQTPEPEVPEDLAGRAIPLADLLSLSEPRESRMPTRPRTRLPIA